METTPVPMLLEQIRAARWLRSPQECEQFEKALAALDERDSDERMVLSGLYVCFEDRTRQPERMWQLVHWIEACEEEVGITTLIEQTPVMQQQAPGWLQILWVRVLNCESARLRLRYEILPLLEKDCQEMIQAYLRSLGGVTGLSI